MIFALKDLENAGNHKKNKLAKYLKIVFSDYQNLD